LSSWRVLRCLGPNVSRERSSGRKSVLNDYPKRLAKATAARYGDDSNEVAQIGLKKRSDRKRPVRKPAEETKE
jgi:hypothetical protein